MPPALVVGEMSVDLVAAFVGLASGISPSQEKEVKKHEGIVIHSWWSSGADARLFSLTKRALRAGDSFSSEIVPGHNGHVVGYTVETWHPHFRALQGLADPPELMTRKRPELSVWQERTTTPNLG